MNSVITEGKTRNSKPKKSRAKAHKVKPISPPPSGKPKKTIDILSLIAINKLNISQFESIVYVSRGTTEIGVKLKDVDWDNQEAIKQGVLRMLGVNYT